MQLLFYFIGVCVSTGGGRALLSFISFGRVDNQAERFCCKHVGDSETGGIMTMIIATIIIYTQKSGTRNGKVCCT